MAPNDLGHLGPWYACGTVFIGQDGCSKIDADNVPIVAVDPSRYKRLQGARALTIVSAIFSGTGALIALLLAIRSKRPSPFAAGAPVFSALVSGFCGILALVLMYTLAEDSFRILNLAYGVTWRVAIAYTVMAFVSQLPFWYLTQYSWETVVMQAASVGPGFVPPSGVFLTPTSRKAFITTTP